MRISISPTMRWAMAILAASVGLAQAGEIVGMVSTDQDVQEYVCAENNVDPGHIGK